MKMSQLSADRRKDCRGMRVEVPITRAIFIYLGDDPDHPGYAISLHPGSVFTVRHKLRILTLRPDLPRAWNANGTIPETTSAAWEYSAVQLSPRDGSVIGGGAFDSEKEALAWVAQGPDRFAYVRMVGDSNCSPEWTPLSP